MKPKPTKKELAARTSISLPPELSRRLDEWVAVRGFENRSQALREMIHQQLADSTRRTATR